MINSNNRAMARRTALLLASLFFGTASAWANAAAGTPEAVLSQATLVSGERKLGIVEVQTDPESLERRFTEGSALLFRSRTRVTSSGFEVSVMDGHPSQKGRFVVDTGRLAVFDAAGQPLWREDLRERLCLPEVIGEFVRAHWDRLSSGAEPLRCLTPIIKAKKVAPLKLTRLPDTPDGRRRVELSAGSLGMRLFVVPTRLTFSADGTQLISHDGQFEAPRSVTGSAAYLRGQASYAPPRPVAAWPTARFAAAPPAQAAQR